MNAITMNAAKGIVTLKGRGKSEREMAYVRIAPLSYSETKGRDETIANLRVALGTSPSDVEAKAAQIEWTIGRVAVRLHKNELPAIVKDDSDRLEFARDLVRHYAAPVKPGAKANKLRAGQKGRRSIAQHKVVRAAEEAWSQVKAELGIGAAQTQSQRNALKRAPAMAGSTARGSAPTGQELVKGPKPMTAKEACAYIVTQAATLQAFANKNAKLVPTDFGQAVIAFKSAINKASNELALREAAKS